MAIERDVVVTLKAKVDQSSLSAVSQFTSALQSAYKTTENASAKAAREQKAAARDAQRAAEQAAKAQAAAAAQVAAASQQAAAKIATANMVIQHSSVKLAKGFLDMAQGLVVLGVSGEENLAKFARAFAQIHAGFQIMRGGIQVVSELTTVWKALAAAQAASAVAQPARGAVAGGAAAGGAAAGTRGLLAGATGRVLGASIGTGAMMFGGLALAGGVAAASAGAAAGRALGFNTEDPLVVLFTTLKAQFFDLAESADRLKKAEEDRLIVLERVRAAEVSRIGILASARQAGEGLARRRDAVSGLTGIAAAEQARLRGLSGLEAAEATLANVRADNPQAQLAAMQQIMAMREQIAAADEESLAANRQNLEVLKAQTQAAQSQLQAARQRVQAEQQATQSRLADFARLDPRQQQELSRISQKMKGGGSLTDAEAAILEQTGFGRGLADKFRAGQAGVAGRDTLAGLGELEALSNAKADEAAAIVKLNQLKAQEVIATDAIAQSVERTRQSFDKLTEALEKFVSMQLADNLNSAAGVNVTGDLRNVQVDKRAQEAVNAIQRAGTVATLAAGAYE